MAFFLGRLVDGDGKPIAARLKDAFGEDRAFSVDFGLTNRRHGQKNSVAFGYLFLEVFVGIDGISVTVKCRRGG